MNFHRLLRPYQEGGTKETHVRRDMGTVIDYLINKKGYPLDVVGGGIFIIFMYLHHGGRFMGDGSYGSKGRELITAIRIECDKLVRIKLESAVQKEFIEGYARESRYYMKPWRRLLIEMSNGNFKIDHSPL